MEPADEQNEAVIEKAIEVGTNYFKDKYDLDVEFTEHQFQPSYVSDNVALNGHVKSEPDQKVYISLTIRHSKSSVPCVRSIEEAPSCWRGLELVKKS